MTTHRPPVISVAIAARNYGRYLPRALNSVLRCHNPTDAPIQVVVADDASTDSTRAVIADFRLRFPQNIDPVFLPVTAGVGPAIAEATADVLRPGGAFLVYQFSPKVRQFIAPFFERIDRDFEWFNVPPATLFWAWKD